MKDIYAVTVSYNDKSGSRYCHTICVARDWQDAQIIVDALKASIPDEQRSEMGDSKIHSIYRIEHRLMHDYDFFHNFLSLDQWDIEKLAKEEGWKLTKIKVTTK